MTRRITPCPSPNGTNREKLYLVKARRELGALDGVKQHGDADTPDLGELHVALEELLTKVLSEGELQEALALLDQHLGASRDYNHAHDEDDEDEEQQGTGRARMREFLGAKGVSDADIDDLFGRMGDLDEMPRPGGGGRLEARDRKRMARDNRRRRMIDLKNAPDRWRRRWTSLPSWRSAPTSWRSWVMACHANSAAALESCALMLSLLSAKSS
jgi:hypothetical protein